MVPESYSPRGPPRRNTRITTLSQEYVLRKPIFSIAFSRSTRAFPSRYCRESALRTLCGVQCWSKFRCTTVRYKLRCFRRVTGPNPMSQGCNLLGEPVLTDSHDAPPNISVDKLIKLLASHDGKPLTQRRNRLSSLEHCLRPGRADHFVSYYQEPPPLARLHDMYLDHQSWRISC